MMRLCATRFGTKINFILLAIAKDFFIPLNSVFKIFDSSMIMYILFQVRMFFHEFVYFLKQ